MKRSEPRFAAQAEAHLEAKARARLAAGWKLTRRWWRYWIISPVNGEGFRIPSYMAKELGGAS